MNPQMGLESRFIQKPLAVFLHLQDIFIYSIE
jgi:hypothetical protein